MDAGIRLRREPMPARVGRMSAFLPLFATSLAMYLDDPEEMGHAVR